MTIPALLLAAAATAAAEGEASKSGLPQLDPSTFMPQLIWLAITYGVLYWALSTFVLPRIGRAIDERRERIQRDIDEAERLKAETDAAIADYEKSLAEARTRASSIAAENRDKLNAEVDAERASVDEQVNAKIAEAEQRIQTMKQSALAQVNDIAADTAGDIVAKLVGGSASADEVKAALNAAAGE
ncbi:MAG: F0F1 ATP synthase subunit B' [Pseudomonadota bacterium]